MSQSLVKFYVHIVFHTKNNIYKIRKNEWSDLYAYMGSIIKDNDSIPIKIGGVEDHVHILCLLSKNITIVKLVEQVKKHSSRWIKTKGPYYSNFKWQRGYGAFSVSKSEVQDKIRYIENQEEHHNKVSYREELIRLLKKADLDYDERYLWND